MVRTRLEQNTVPMNDGLTALLARAVDRSGFPLHMMASGAGHDAMVLAPHLPCAMLFVRSPGGVSHHPDEKVLASDVAAALATGRQLIEDLAHHD
jgi:allantoate deiminase